jgi:hypothetical protein
LRRRRCTQALEQRRAQQRAQAEERKQRAAEMRLEADRLAEESAARRAAAQARRDEEAEAEEEEAPSFLSPVVSPMPSASSPSPLPSTSLPPTLLSEAAAADEAPRGLPTTTPTESGGSGSVVASPQPTYESPRDTAPDSEPADAVEAPAQQRDWAEERRQKRLQWEEEREQARQAHEAEMEARNAERLAARAARQQAAAELELQAAAAGPEPPATRSELESPVASTDRTAVADSPSLGIASLFASPQPTYESPRDTAPDSEPADAVEAPAQQRDWAEERRQKRLQWEEEREQARQAHEAEMEARNGERLAARAARQQAAAELELQAAAAGPEPEPERQDGLPSSSFGRSPISLIPTRSSTLTPMVSRPFSSWNRSILTEIYICHTCSYHEIEDGNGPDRERAQW